MIVPLRVHDNLRHASFSVEGRNFLDRNWCFSPNILWNLGLRLSFPSRKIFNWTWSVAKYVDCLQFRKLLRALLLSLDMTAVSIRLIMFASKIFGLIWSLPYSYGADNYVHIKLGQLFGLRPCSPKLIWPSCSKSNLCNFSSSIIRGLVHRHGLNRSIHSCCDLIVSDMLRHIPGRIHR